MLPSLIAGRGSGVILYDGPHLKLFILVSLGRASCLLLVHRGSTCVFFFLLLSVSKLFGAKGQLNESV